MDLTVGQAHNEQNGIPFAVNLNKNAAQPE